MKQLAIKGHTTRGKEVIEILEMLGGKVEYVYDGTAQDWVYFINEEGFIDCGYLHYPHDIYTLEAFLEKFPYKVGDKAFAFGNKCTIIGAVWDESIKEVVYTIKLDTSKYTTTKLSYQLQPYKEETMEETKKKLDWHPTDYLEFVDNDEWADEVELNLGDSYEIQVRGGQTFAIKKQPQYPKTCEECLKILGKTMNSLDNMRGYKYALFMRLQQLLISREAYWKIAGEQMGLGKPWEPAMQDTIWGITRSKDEVEKYSCHYGKTNLLEFPTEEMRDEFFENFKDLIERCKELL